MGGMDVNLMRGTLELLILKSLSWGPQHGYGIAEWIASMTDELLAVGEGTLYPALHRLESGGLIASEWGVSENNRRAKFYRLARLGRKRLEQGTQSWERFVGAAGRALRTATPVRD